MQIVIRMDIKYFWQQLLDRFALFCHSTQSCQTAVKISIVSKSEGSYIFSNTHIGAINIFNSSTPIYRLQRRFKFWLKLQGTSTATFLLKALPCCLPLLPRLHLRRANTREEERSVGRRTKAEWFMRAYATDYVDCWAALLCSIAVLLCCSALPFVLSANLKIAR